MKTFVSEHYLFVLMLQGPVVQNFVCLTLSLSPQFVNYISTSKANTLLFFVEKDKNSAEVDIAPASGKVNRP